MRRSRLEIYVDIISALADRAMTIDDIGFACNTSCTTLQQKLDFLIIQDIVSVEIAKDNRAFYVLSRRGTAIYKTFNVAKNLEKLQEKLGSQELQIVADLEDRYNEETRGVE